MDRRLLALIALLVACDEAEPEDPCPGQVQDEETEQCVPVECGTTPWGPAERPDDAVHVAPWGDDDWDGSEAWPYRTVNEGLAVAIDEGRRVVALAAGTWEERVENGQGLPTVEIWGRCAALTVLDGTNDEELPGIVVSGGELTLRGLTATGGYRGIAVVGLSGALGSAPVLVADGIVVDGAIRNGILVQGGGAHATLERSVIKNTETWGAGYGGRGATVEGGARLLARDVLFERNHEIAVFAGGATVELEDVVIRDTQPAVGSGGPGLVAIQGGTISAVRTRLEGNGDANVSASGPSTRVELTDSEVLDGVCRDGFACLGLSAGDGATLATQGVAIERAWWAAAEARNNGLLDLNDTVIRDVLPVLQSGVEVASGINLWQGGRLATDGLVIEDLRGYGINLRGASEAALVDSTVRRIASTLDQDEAQDLEDGSYSTHGIIVDEGSSLSAEGLTLDELPQVGLLVINEGSSAEVVDLTVTNSSHVAVNTQHGATLTGARLRFEDNAGMALRLASGSTATLSDVQIRGQRADPRYGGAAGLAMLTGATATIEGLSMEGVPGVGVRVLTGAQLDLIGGSVAAMAPDLDESGGTALNIDGEGRLAASDFLVEDALQIGISAFGPEVDLELTDVTVRRVTPLEDLRIGVLGYGVVLGGGVSSTIDGLTIEDVGGGLLAFGVDTDLQATDVAIRRARSAAIETGGGGLIAQELAVVEVDGLTVEDTDGPGLYLVGGDLTVTDATLRGNGFASVLTVYGSLDLRDSEVLDSREHYSEGGGVGLYRGTAGYVWPLIDLNVTNVRFAGHAGPALYLRENGRYVVRDCTVEDAGTEPFLPGGVFAVEGVVPWASMGFPEGLERGLWLEGHDFSALSGEVILLDDSSATLAEDADTGAANAFGGDVAPTVQNCGDGAGLAVLDGSLPAVECAAAPRPLGPLLDYAVRPGETGLGG